MAEDTVLQSLSLRLHVDRAACLLAQGFLSPRRAGCRVLLGTHTFEAQKGGGVHASRGKSLMSKRKESADKLFPWFPPRLSILQGNLCSFSESYTTKAGSRVWQLPAQ